MDRIADAHELMGSTCLDDHHDLQLALQYWRKAIRIRNGATKEILPPAAHLNSAREFCTIEELDNLSIDLDAMRTQSLLICERILGSSHKDAIFRFMYRGAAYADSLRYQPCIDLWKYALQLRVEKDTLLYNETCFAARALVRIFLDLHEKHGRGLLRESLQLKDVVSSLHLLVDNMEQSLMLLRIKPVFRRHQDNFDRILNCVTHLVFLLSSSHKCEPVYQIVRRLVRINPRTFSGETLLHLATNRDNAIKSSNYFDEPQGTHFPSVGVTQLLIDCGADVSALDKRGNTPLHIACRVHNFTTDLIQLLLQHGSHIDQTNADGERPSVMLLKIPSCGINPHQHISLKCLAATVIRASKIQYRNEIPLSLEPFIEMH